jgi:hypothetical protein
MKRTRWAGLAMASVLTVLLATCTSAGAVETSAPAVATDAAPGVGTDAAPVAAASTGPAAAPDIFTGTDHCRAGPAPSGTDPATTVLWSCDRTTNDPRINGPVLGSITSVSGDQPQEMAVGSGTLTNDGGSWECEAAWGGASESKVGWGDQVCLGHGGYVGLTAYVHSLTGNDPFTYGVIGSIEKTP